MEQPGSPPTGSQRSGAALLTAPRTLQGTWKAQQPKGDRPAGACGVAACHLPSPGSAAPRTQPALCPRLSWSPGCLPPVWGWGAVEVRLRPRPQRAQQATFPGTSPQLFVTELAQTLIPELGTGAPHVPAGAPFWQPQGAGGCCHGNTSTRDRSCLGQLLREQGLLSGLRECCSGRGSSGQQA